MGAVGCAMNDIPAQLMYLPRLDTYISGVMFRTSALPEDLCQIFVVFDRPELTCGLCHYHQPHVHPDSFVPTVNLATGTLIWAGPLGSEPGVLPPRNPRSWRVRRQN